MRGSTTNSADMKSKVLDITRPQWWEASVLTKNTVPVPQLHSANVIREYF